MTTVFDSPNKTREQDQNVFFYLNYLDYENHLDILAADYDPHTRLTHFHLAILEQVDLCHHAIAYQIYLDLVSKKSQFMIQDDHFHEELKDVMTDIVSSLQECGYPASLLDLL